MKRFFICGFMGAGKSSFLGRLATQAEQETKEECSGQKINFIDFDELFVSLWCREGESLGGYILRRGLVWFRLVEQVTFMAIFLEHTCHNQRGVYALGGGQLNEDLVSLIQSSSEDCLIFLDIPVVECWKRVSAYSSPHRPLVHLGWEHFSELYAKRRGIYSLADVILTQESLEKVQSLDQLGARIERRGRSYARAKDHLRSFK